MLRPQGTAIIYDPDAPSGVALKRDTITCGHCQAVVFVKPGTASTVYLVRDAQGQTVEEPGAGCFLCGRAVCLACYDRGVCLPWEQQMEQMEARARLRRIVTG